MTFLLDTMTLVALAGWSGSHASLAGCTTPPGRPTGVSTINITEVFTGAHAGDRDRWRSFLITLEIRETRPTDAKWAGIRRYDLARQGFVSHLEDATIAAVARRVGATVVTDNVKDFERLGVPAVRPA